MTATASERDARPSILAVMPWDPYERTIGATLRVRAVLEGLRALGHVHLLTVGPSDGDGSGVARPTWLTDLGRIERPRSPAGVSAARELVVTGWPRALAAENRRAVAAALRDADVCPSDHDVVWVGREVLLGLLADVGLPERVVVDVDDLQVDRVLTPGARVSPPTRVLAAAERRAWRRLQRRRAARGWVAVVSNPLDAPRLPSPTALVPNPAPAVDVPPAPVGSRTALFVGTMSYPPNAIALEWLAAEVWPEVRSRLPDARVRVVGRVGDDQRAHHDPDRGIEVTGAVPDVAPYLAEAAVVLVPIRHGAGTSIKALEAMVARRPLVSTTAGLRGVPDPSSLALVADTTGSFAEAVVSAMTEPQSARVEAAAAFVDARHSPTAITRAVRAAVDGVRPRRGDR